MAEDLRNYMVSATGAEGNQSMLGNQSLLPLSVTHSSTLG